MAATSTATAIWFTIVVREHAQNAPTGMNPYSGLRIGRRPNKT
jgi:hypothetical protein